MLNKEFPSITQKESLVLNSNGFSFLEIIVVLLIMSIMVGMGTAIHLEPMKNSLATTTSNIESFMKYARSKAISTTSAVHIKAINHSTIVGINGKTCSTVDINDTPQMSFKLDQNVVMTDLEWETCFTARGLATQNAEIPIIHDGKTRTIEIMLGGGARVK